MLTMAEAKSAESAERAIRASEGMAEALHKLAAEVAWQGGFAEDFAADSLWQFCGELLADYCEPDEDEEESDLGEDPWEYDRLMDEGRGVA